MSADVVFTMACKNGHNQDVDENTARYIIATACPKCGKPLFLKGVKVGGAR